MVKLRDVYDNVENPLENPEILQKIVTAYAKSSRTDLFGSSDLYSSLVKMNKTEDFSSINLSDRDAFYIETYNQWIENMLSLDDSHIEYLETKKRINAKEMQQYLKSFGKVNSMEDIKRLKSNPLFDKEINGWELNDGWDHFKSQYISARTENRISVKHRLYVGCQNQDMWKLAQLFKSKCEAQQIPFYFKLASSSDRDDKMVIYADTDNLANYISTLQEIAQENPEIMQRCGEPPALTGKIDKWIGIGDEPPLKADGSNQSYNTLRSDIFEDAIEETLISDITEFKGKDIPYNGKQTRFNDLFIEQVSKILLDKLDNGKNTFSSNLSIYDLTEKDLSSPKFKEHIKTHLKKNIQKGLNKLLEVKDIKSQIAVSNGQSIFTIPTRNGKSLGVNTNDMDSIIKSMIPIMQSVDPDFMDKVKNSIKIKCKENGIDDTFCFQEGTKEKFEQQDLQQLSKAKKTVITPQTKDVKSTTLKEKMQPSKVQKTTTIRSAEIAELLNPQVLKQKIELPNGANIPARQYVQEIVAPHIPSNGKFILSNGLQISAQQFIEEYILGEGQQKYTGNISKLLSENTRSNNGTITIDGKQINSIDIIDSLNPELMQRKIKLPNGVEIPATQYVQEIVAPHIPSNGKFILKSNGYAISAKQFIEEAVMFEGQEKYNGDIVALLEAMTSSNNGTIDIENKKKDPRGQELKQEMGISPVEMRKRQEEQQSIQEEKKQNEKLQATQDNANSPKQKKLSTKNLESDISESISECQISADEVNNFQHEIVDRDEYRRLMVMGRTRTAEQEKRFVELQNIYQTNQKQKKQHQDHGQGIGR